MTNEIETIHARYDELHQIEEWRKQVAIELNLLSTLAEAHEEAPDAESQKVAATLWSIIERVANFEEIKCTLEGKPSKPPTLLQLVTKALEFLVDDHDSGSCVEILTRARRQHFSMGHGAALSKAITEASLGSIQTAEVFLNDLVYTLSQ